MSAQAPDGGGTWQDRRRFLTCNEAKTAYEHVREKRGTMTSLQNVVKQYERFPYVDERGSIKSNFGQLRYKVDQALTTFTDFATERRTWYRVSTYEGVNDGKAKLWGELITTAFQRFCIKPWKRSPWELMVSCKDMLMFSNGILMWDDTPGTVYPESKESITVWPDAMASQFAEDWDMCFVETAFTAQKLFEKVEDKSVAEANGWNRSAVLDVLKASNAEFDNESPEHVFDCFRLGELSADVKDHVIDVVIMFVREYHSEGGNRVTKLVFQRVPPSTGEKNSSEGQKFLMEKPNYTDHIGRYVQAITQVPTRKFYESTSFALTIYPVCKQYDIILNRVLEALEDNMRVYLRVDSQDQLERLATMRHGSFQGLEPGLKIEQDSVNRPVKDSVEVLRMAMIDMNVGTGQYQVGEQTAQGGPKTATQAEIDLSESTKISSAHLKMFNMSMTPIGEEIYRRFVEQSPGDPHYENLKRFKSYLEDQGVPEKAWKVANVCVESILNLGAGSPAAKLQGGRIVLEALQAPARTPGERQAKRDIVASAVGVENVEAYIPSEEDLAVPEDSLIGLENDALIRPGSNPRDIPVHPQHLHMRHIPRHIGAMEASMDIVEGLYQNMGGMPQEDTSVILHTITDTLIGVDNLGSHAKAHIILASERPSKTVKTLLDGEKRRLQEVNRRQDKMEGIIGQQQQKRLEESRAAQQQSPEAQKMQLELEHDAQMKAQQLDHERQMNSIKQGAAAQDAQTKNSVTVSQAQAKAQADRIQTAAKTAQNGQENGSGGRGA